MNYSQNLKLKTEKIILGIDPGTTIMGYGVIKCEGNKIDLIKTNVFHFKNLNNHAIKLKQIFQETLQLINDYKPDELSIEAPFYGKNIQSMLKLGRAQGVAMAAALNRGIPIFEYSPRKIKQSITGNGNASKEQVAAMLQKLLVFKITPKYLDATDGLAVAVCHFFQKNNYNHNKKNYKGWKGFIENNPERKIEQ